MSDVFAEPRKRDSHIWERESYEHYVEPAWCSARLFEEERFGAVHDPCCGFGTIVKSAWAAGLSATGADLINRGFERGGIQDFFVCHQPLDCIVCNPPFNIANHFALHALKVAIRKVAMIFPTSRLNAAHWLRDTPLRRVWLMSPRPSMPPGHVIAAGGKPGGGKMDYCWLVWDNSYTGTRGSPELRWLYRDKPNSSTLEYDGQDDFAKSLDVGYAAIRERVAAGGKGCEPK